MLQEIETAEADPRWRAIEARDAGADGEFVFSVRTTGIYCRPSCPARHAKRENVAFHAGPAEAERAGFRPCKRCRPNEASPRERRAAMVASACRAIEAAEEEPSLDALAREADLSLFHFHRLFKAETGVTPKAYAKAERARRMRRELADGGTVTEAIYGAGYGSNSRFYEAADATLGMTPTRFRSGGAGAEIRYAVGPCSLGQVIAAATEKGVCFIAIDDDAKVLEESLKERFPKARLVAGDEGFAAKLERVVELVERPEAGLDLPLDIQGTAFQQRVWRALTDIPAGRTRSYSDVARAIGAPKAVRAVAAACGANKIAVAIPCHRVVGADGALTGYRWGVERKRALLKREGG